MGNSDHNGNQLTSSSSTDTKKTLDAVHIVHVKMLREIISQLIKKNESLQVDVDSLRDKLLNDRIEMNNKRIKIFEEAAHTFGNINSVSQTEINQAAERLSSVCLWPLKGTDFQRIRNIPKHFQQMKAAKNAVEVCNKAITQIKTEIKNIRNEFDKSSPATNSPYISSAALEKKQELLDTSENELKRRLQELDHLLAEKKLRTLFFDTPSLTPPPPPQGTQPSQIEAVRPEKSCTI